MAIKESQIYPFDSIGFAKRLTDVGMPSEQANTLAQLQMEYIHALLEILASKADLILVKKDLKAVEERLTTKIETSINQLKSDLKLWFGTMLVIAFGINISIIGVMIKFLQSPP